MANDKQKKIMQTQTTEDFMIRSLNNRFGTFSKSVMAFVGYLMGLGDTYDEAIVKSKELSNYIRVTDGGVKFDYIIGDTQPLLDVITNCTTLAFLDQDAKDFLITELTPPE